jgi:CRISPR-associated protein Csd1
VILQALYKLYLHLLHDPDSAISPPGYSRAKVSFVLNLSESGELLDVFDLRQASKSRRALAPADVDVPRQVKRSSGISANFLCDNSTYVLGIDSKENPNRSAEAFREFLALHEEILGPVKDVGAGAVLAFLRKRDPLDILDLPLWKDMIAAGNIVFRLNNTSGFVHDRAAVRRAWEDHCSSEVPTEIRQCLVTGEDAPIARLHDNAKGVRGAQSSGAALVSFNLDAFTSYGKTQSYNAPVSAAAAFGYVTALNYLLGSARHRLLIGETTVVFWAERSTGAAEDLFAQLLNAGRDGTPRNGASSSVPQIDPGTTELVMDILDRASRGLPVRDGLTSIDTDVRFHVLGLSPNAARVAVRFWHVDTFGAMIQRVASHHADMAIVAPPQASGPYPVREIVRSTAPLGDSERASPLLSGALMRSILLGVPYPQGLLAALLLRVRSGIGASADGGGVTSLRAAAIKAFLLRRARVYGCACRKEDLTVGLSEESNNSAYLLGRLFAVLEKAQEDATPGIGSTIRERYFGAASTTPRTAFPVLLRLAQHHIAKAEYGSVSDRRVEEIVGRLRDFPAHLSLEQQGVFVLGYYHQRQAFFQRKAPAAQSNH